MKTLLFGFRQNPTKAGIRAKTERANSCTLCHESFPRVTLIIERVTSNDTTVVFEVRSEGMIQNHAYQNQAAIAFDVKDGKICAYREYLGVIYQLK